MGVHLERARVLAQLGRAAQAEEELRRELAERPEHSEAHRMLAWCLASQGRLPQARTEAEEAIRLQPDVALVHYTLGWVLIRQRRWEEAEKALRESIRLDPQDADYFFALAHLFSERERWLESAEAARQGLRLDPDNVNCANSLAHALLQMNRLTEAHQILETLMIKDPENSWAHINQGLFYQEQKNLEKSLYHFREAARINPDNSDAHKVIKKLGSRIASAKLFWGLFTLVFIIFMTLLLVNYVIEVINFIFWGRRPQRPPEQRRRPKT